jgi:hypothetical protein
VGQPLFMGLRVSPVAVANRLGLCPLAAFAVSGFTRLHEEHGIVRTRKIPCMYKGCHAVHSEPEVARSLNSLRLSFILSQQPTIAVVGFWSRHLTAVVERPTVLHTSWERSKVSEQWGDIDYGSS